jgi:hypothetical protein
MTATAISFPLSKHTAGGDTAPAFSGLHVYSQFMWEMGLPHSPVEFSSHRHFYKLSCSWLLGVCCCSCLLQPACCEEFPLPTSLVLRVPCPLCYVSFLLLLLIIQFFSPFFPRWGSICPGGFADLAQDCLWELLKWRCYAQVGGVEESKFCLFSVVFPVRCISSISLRFYFRRHTFCFLPLATILESSRLPFRSVISFCIHDKEYTFMKAIIL